MLDRHNAARARIVDHHKVGIGVFFRDDCEFSGKYITGTAGFSLT